MRANTDNLHERKSLNFNDYNSYDSFDEETIGLYSGDINNFDKYAEKYIDKNKFIVYLLLQIANPMTKIKMVEGTMQNILDVAYSKKCEHKCIYIFYHLNSQKVKTIKYII